MQGLFKLMGIPVVGCGVLASALCMDKDKAHKLARAAGVSVPRGCRLARPLDMGAGSVLLHGKKAPVAGMVCMDQALVDVTETPQASPGDTAVVIGKSGCEEIRAADLAAQAGTIPNEILSRLGQRLGRFLC